jgi:hypothetical protein
MHPTRSNTAHRTAQEAMATTPPPLDATPESPPHRTPPRPRPTRGDASAPAERVRVTDVPAHGRGRAYLVERGLEHDGYSALKALVADYVEQGALLAAVPMTVSPLESEASEGVAR